MLKIAFLDLFKLENDQNKLQKYNEYYLSGNIKFEISIQSDTYLAINHCRDYNSKICGLLRLYSRFSFTFKNNKVTVMKTYYNNENKIHNNDPAIIVYNFTLSNLLMSLKDLLEKLPSIPKIIEKEIYYTNGQLIKDIEYYQSGKIFRLKDCHNEIYYDKKGNIISVETAYKLFRS